MSPTRRERAWRALRALGALPRKERCHVKCAGYVRDAHTGQIQRCDECALACLGRCGIMPQDADFRALDAVLRGLK